MSEAMQLAAIMTIPIMIVCVIVLVLLIWYNRKFCTMIKDFREATHCLCDDLKQSQTQRQLYGSPRPDHLQH